MAEERDGGLPLRAQMAAQAMQKFPPTCRKKGPRKLRKMAPPLPPMGERVLRPWGGRKGFQISIYPTRRRRGRPLDPRPDPRNGIGGGRQKANMASENSSLFCQTDQRGRGRRLKRRRGRGPRKWKGEEEEEECSIIDKRRIRKGKSGRKSSAEEAGEARGGMMAGGGLRFPRGWTSATRTRGAPTVNGTKTNLGVE